MVAAVTDANFVEETKDGLVLIDFWATWCGPCRMQAPILEQLAGEVHEDEVKILKMDVDEIQILPVNLVLCPFRPFYSRKTVKSLSKSLVFTPKISSRLLSLN